MARQRKAQIEKIDVVEVIKILDDKRLRAAMPGLSDDARLRLLAQCQCLRGGDNEVAVFRPVMFGDFTAVILDIDTGARFVADALDWVFAEIGARRLQFSTQDAAGGQRWGARLLGPYQMPGCGYAWELTAEAWKTGRPSLEGRGAA